MAMCMLSRDLIEAILSKLADMSPRDAWMFASTCAAHRIATAMPAVMVLRAQWCNDGWTGGNTTVLRMHRSLNGACGEKYSSLCINVPTHATSLIIGDREAGGIGEGLRLRLVDPSRNDDQWGSFILKTVTRIEKRGTDHYEVWFGNNVVASFRGKVEVARVAPSGPRDNNDFFEWEELVLRRMVCVRVLE